VYISGYTGSADLPTSEDAVQPAPPGTILSPFIARFDGDLGGVLSATYLGGSGVDGMGFYLAIGSGGSVFGASNVFSADFPVTPDAFQAQRVGRTEAVVVELDPALTELRYSSYFGGAADDGVTGIAMASNGSLLVSGGYTFVFN